MTETRHPPRRKIRGRGGIRATRVFKRRVAAMQPRLRAVARRAGVAAIVTGVALLLPPVRRTLSAGWEVVIDAVASGRRAEHRRLAIVRFAEEYRIPLELATEIERAAYIEGLDPDLAFRLVRVESEFNPDAVSSVGALGLTQLMPSTARALQPGITRAEILEPRTNLRLGFHYLRQLLDIYDGNLREALHAYNRGPGTVARLRRQGRNPANGYADKVLHLAGQEKYSGSGFAD